MIYGLIYLDICIRLLKYKLYLNEKYINSFIKLDLLKAMSKKLHLMNEYKYNIFYISQKKNSKELLFYFSHHLF
jgi:hypothetical protein